MKIVLVIDQFDDSNNGTTVTARRFAGQLRRRGHEVVILAGGAPCEGKICALYAVPLLPQGGGTGPPDGHSHSGGLSRAAGEYHLQHFFGQKQARE